MSTNSQGVIAVAKFIFQFSMRGVTVALPIDSSRPYDMIVDVEGKLLKIQTKSAMRSTSEYLTVKVQRTHLLSGRNVYKNYTQADFDLLGVYDVIKSKCYLLPPEVWEDKGSLRLRYDELEGSLHVDDFEFDRVLDSINTTLRV